MNKTLITVLILTLLESLSFAQSTSAVYVRGTGYNFSPTRQIKVGGVNYAVSGRGLCLSLFNAQTHAHISSTRYDTYGSAADSEALAVALNSIQRGQIGVLASYDAWEDNVTENLKIAARRLGLYKLGGGLDAGSRRPYAAIFRGAGTGTSNTEPGHIAYEVMQSNDADGESAIIASYLIDDAFIGNNLANALIAGDGTKTGATLIINENEQVGIGTSDPQFKLDVAGTSRFTGHMSVENIETKNIKVTSIPGSFPDYVFNSDYQLKPLAQVHAFIQANGHLPNMPKAEEVEADGQDLSLIQIKLLEKIEELTLYTIEQEKKIAAKATKIQKLEEQLEQLLKRIEDLEKK